MITRLFAVVYVFALVGGASAQPPKDKPKHTNLLAKETSPYLLMHAHNPTNWHAWGPAAFEKAKKEKKLVFLSVGYSSCYWCHVMERESFNNEAVAKLLNDSFVCIKVDREERPDIDHIYMTAHQALRGGGGWPLSMFLLPDGRPIVGGTYWPREDKVVDGEKSLGFMSLLKIVGGAWKDEPESLEKQAEKLSTATLQALGGGPGIAIVGLDRKLVQGVVDDLKEEFDPQYGGFGSPNRKFRGPKFPTPPRLELVLQVAQRTKDKELLNMVTFTLDKMAHGGIWDHLGGGFHRYTVERTWTVPHFEKMLYDNAQLTELYAKAYAVTKKPLYRKVVDETLAYVQREMLSPEGAFYSSQDAETHHEEGRFYVWTPEELAAALLDKGDLAFIRNVYGADTVNFEGKYHILKLPKPLPEIAADLKLTEEQLTARLAPLSAKLFAERAKRDKPFRNEIALTAWSGQMIAGYAEAGRSLPEPKYLETAKRTADFVLKNQVTPEGRLLRTYGAAPGQKPKAAVNGYLEDYAFLVHGLLTLHEATGEARWLEASKKLTDVMIQFHADKQGGFFMTASDHEKLFARSKDQYDGAQPSGNSVAARNLARLYALTGDDKWRDEARRTFRVFAGSMKTSGTGLTALTAALDAWLDVQEQPKEGKKSKEQTGAKTLFDGKSLDGWKSAGYIQSGKVYVKDGAIVMEKGARMTGVAYQGKDFPKMDYEVSFEGKRLDGEDFFATATFPVGDAFCSLVAGGWGGQVVGLSSLNSADASENDTGTSKEFKKDQWYKFRIRVTKDRIQTWIDKDQVINVDTSDRKISIRFECDNCKPFGFCTWDTIGAVRDIRVRPLTEAEKKEAEKKKD